MLVDVEIVNLLDPMLNKAYGQKIMVFPIGTPTLPHRFGGEFAAFEQTETSVIVARTIGVPARIACQVLASNRVRMFIAHTIREIREAWFKDVCRETWSRQKPFDPLYTEMIPAFHSTTISLAHMRERTYTCFLNDPPYTYRERALYEPEVERIGKTYIALLQSVIRDQLTFIPDDVPVGVALSGGADSGTIAFLLCDELRKQQRKNVVFCCTLAIDGGGRDLVQAQSIAALLEQRYGSDRIHFVPIEISSSAIDVPALKRRAAFVLEEYHSRDVECGMAGLLLYDAIQTRVANGALPSITYDFNGDGGNETFRDYPLEDEGYGPIPLEEVYSNPHLYFLGYARSKLAFNPMFSSGLSRSYTRTFNPARRYGVRTFSPMIDRCIVDFGQRLPLRQLAPTAEKLYALRGEIIRAGLKQILGVDLPIFPKTRFQEGCSTDPGLLRVTREDVVLLKNLVLGRTGPMTDER